MDTTCTCGHPESAHQVDLFRTGDDESWFTRCEPGCDCAEMTTERIVLRFDRLTDGTLVAVHQGVAAIVHPLVEHEGDGYDYVSCGWTLAGEGFIAGEHRPMGVAESRNGGCAEAAEALGVHLGVTVDGYEIAP